MLLSLYAPALLAALSLADPIPIYNQDVHLTVRSAETKDLTVIKGGPALYPRNAEPIPAPGPDDASGSLPAHLFSRALSADHQEALRLHNAARAKKKLKPLAWDHTLWTHAKAYAKSMAASGKFAHCPASQRPGEGENLAYTWSSGTIKNPITVGTKAWLDEAKNYHGEVIPKGDFADYGHWTQLMWNGTTKVGFSAAQSKKGAWYIVARYSPPGNVYGKKAYN